MKTVPELLRDAADIYEQRASIYGDNYKNFGDVMMGLFPHPVVLDNPDDWNRIGLFVQMVSKMTRYAQQFDNGGHADSLDDGSVYSMMLREIDAEIEAKKKVVDMRSRG